MPFDQRSERSTRKYQKARAAFLHDHPLCAECERNGIIRAADELDHIVPVRDNPDGFWDSENWQGLCRACHEAKTARENWHQAGESPERAAWRMRVFGDDDLHG